MWWIVMGAIGAKLFGIIGLIVGIIVGVAMDDEAQERRYKQER